MRYVVHILVFLVAVVAGVAVGVPGLVERAGRQVEAKLEDKLGVDIDVESVDWTFSGDVELRGITLKDRAAPTDEVALLTIDALEVRSDVDYSGRTVRLRSVVARGPNVNLKRRKDGSDNASALLGRVVSLLKGEEVAAGSSDGGNGSGMLRYLDRSSLPSVSAEGIVVNVDAGDVKLPETFGVPRQVTLSKGTLTVKNTSLLKEDPVLDIALKFADTTLDPGFGVKVATTIEPNGGKAWWETPIELHFDRPARVLVGRRVAALGSIIWRAGAPAPLVVRDVALSVPLSEDDLAGAAPVSPALEAEAVKVGLGALTFDDLKDLVSAGSDTLSAVLRKIVQRVGRLELVKPAVVFERTPTGHNFNDLVRSSPGKSDPVTPPDDAPGPDKALGVLMDATRSASILLTTKGAATNPVADGSRFRSFIQRGVGHLDRRIVKLTNAAIAAASKVPFKHLVINGGRFVWRDMRAPADGQLRLREKLENFNLTARRSDELLTFEASFQMPRQLAGRTAAQRAEAAVNKVSGKVHLLTGDTQLQAQLQRLELHPYRQAFPRTLKVYADTALVDTDLTMLWSPTTEIARIEGRFGLENGGFHYPALSAEPVAGLNLRLKFGAQMDRKRKTIVLRQSDLRIGSVNLKVRADIARYDASPKMSAAMRLERSRAQDLVDSIPLQIMPLLEGLKVVGTVAWHFDFSLDTANMESLDYHSFPEINGFRVVDMGSRLNINAVRGSFIHRIVEADGTKREMLIGPGSTYWTPIHAISPYVAKGVTTTEDGAFYRHKGFSSFAIRSSLVTNLKKGRFARGASTISQQLVKNLFLSREKTLSRKFQELFITWQMEDALSKDRIMELYLNIIEWGPGIYGIRHATRHYFGKQPSALSPLESAFLVSLIPNPKKYYWQFKRGEVSDGWRRHLRWIMGVMRDRGKITDGEYLAAAPYSPVFRGQQKKLVELLDEGTAQIPTAAVPPPE